MPIEWNAVIARYENGLFWVTFPKALKSEPERVDIQRSSIKE